MKGNSHASRRPRIATNLARLQAACSGNFDFEQIPVRKHGSWTHYFELLFGKDAADLILINIDTTSLYRLCFLRLIVPRRAARLVSVDIIFSSPQGMWQKLQALLKRVLLTQVDLFVLYFRDLAGYARHYGIDQRRSAYVPFKSNSWEILDHNARYDSGGEYVLAAGRTKRDLATFLAAMRIARLPAVLLHQGHERLSQHGTTLPDEELPGNVRYVEHVGGQVTWVEHMKKARVVVVPVLPTTISSSGIGTSIDAMLLNKALVITDSPTTRGIIEDQAVVVPPTDPEAMAAAVTRLWNDADARESLGRHGRQYAIRLEGEARLLNDIVRTCIDRGLLDISVAKP